MEKMVLPDRIVLSTSPLPMECSTTELRQHAPDTRIGPKGPQQSGPILATSPPPAQAREGPDRSSKRRKSALDRRGELNWPIAGRFGSRFLPKCCGPGSNLSLHGVVFAFFAQAPECPHGGRQGAQSCRRRGHRSIARADAPRSRRLTMTDDKDRGKGRPAGNSRQDRLKLALRENLKRRKSQARGRSDAHAAPRDDAGASLHDELDKKPGD